MPVPEVEYEPEDEPAEEQRPEPSVARPGKRRLFKTLSIVGGILAAVLAAGGGYAWWQYRSLEPDRLHDLAHKEYSARQFQQARVHFEKIANDHPSHRHAAEARFFVELCGLQQAVRVVTVQENPTPAIAEWERFLKAIEDPALAPFAAKDRFGIDIWEGGGKLAEDIVAKATREFDADKPDVTEEWLKKAAAVEAETERFRPDSVNPSASSERPCRTRTSWSGPANEWRKSLRSTPSKTPRSGPVVPANSAWKKTPCMSPSKGMLRRRSRPWSSTRRNPSRGHRHRPRTTG